MVSWRTGIFFKSISRPTPDASAISHNAPKMPPSVTSCIAATPCFTAMEASGSTDSSWSKAFAPSINGWVNRVRSCSSFSFAIIEVPSMPAHFVIIISIPGRAPAVEISFPFFALPTPTTEISGWHTAFVTSVCPPIICTCTFAQAASACAIMCRIFCSLTRSGSRTVSIMPTGSAPALARSLTVICTASSPISCTVPVIGSVDITSISSSATVTAAQSSPTEAPKSTSSLRV